jgi:hypothetical protein
MNRRSFISLMFGLGLISQRTTLKTPVNESKEQYIEVSGSGYARQLYTRNLSTKDSARFVEVLLNPPKPNRHLQRAAVKHKELVRKRNPIYTGF